MADEGLVHLRWLAERLGSDPLDAAVVTTGEHAYRRHDGIAVIPAALLGPRAWPPHQWGIRDTGGVLVEFTDKKRNRMWRAPQVLEALDRFAAREGRRARARH